MCPQNYKAIGFEGITVGFSQRAALLCLWLACTLVLVMVSNGIFKSMLESGAVKFRS